MAKNGKRPRDIGRGSPGSEEAKQQNASGARGAAQGDRPAGEGRQPQQASGRRGARHEHAPSERKHFEEGHAPSEQGDGTPGPEQLKESQGLQGIGQGGGRSGAENKESIAQRGAPDAGHTRSGRSRVPGRGERPPND